MSYIGRDIRTGAFRQLDDISSGFDGSDTTHTMQVNSTNVSVGDVNQILLSLGGVIQKPGTDFTVSGSTLTFTTAPAANTSFFAILLGSDNGGTVTPTDGSVTGDKVASTGAFTIGAAGTASSLAGISFYKADNSIYTHDVSGTDNTAEFNTAFGVNALDAITDGDKHVAIGYNAGTAVTTAVGNVLIGEAAGAALTTGGSNTLIGRLVGDGFDTEANNLAIGVAALGGSVAGGEYNVAIGNYAGDALTSGDHNVFVGYNAGSGNTSGQRAVVIGGEAMDSAATTSTGNIVIGWQAGRAITSGEYNLIAGYQSGAAITTGSANVALGQGCLTQPDTESNNIAIGMDTMNAAIAGGEYNIAIGRNVLDALTSGDGNTSLGYSTASALTTGNYNVALGYAAMAVGVTTGAGNVCIGNTAGYDLTSGSGNTFVGDRAGYECTSQSASTAIGIYSGYNLTTGDGGNTLAGYASAYNLTTGVNNTVIGYDAGRPGSPGGSLVTTSHNICLGDERISACHVQVDWTIASDQRDKTDFTALDLGLDFVNDLKPYTYKWDKRSKYGDKKADDYDLNAQTPDGTHKEDWLDIGFKAQEVEALEKAAGYKIADKTNLTTSLSEDGKQYGIKYSNFVPILVKAVQELSAKVKALEEA